MLNGLSEQEAFIVGEYARTDILPTTGRAAGVSYGTDFPLRSDAEWAERLMRIP